MTDDTLHFQAQQHRDRWSGFGADAGILKISEGLPASELRKIDMFREYDDVFLKQIGPDISIATWAPNAVLFEEGSYIDVAFYVLEGAVAVYLASKADGPVGVPIFDAQQTGDTAAVEGRAEDPGATLYRQRADRNTDAVLLTTMDFDLPSGGATVRLSAGEFFGEIGALSGWPQSVTARTLNECRLVQIRLPALRQMKRRSQTLKATLDARYRERSLLPHLAACPLLSDCPTAMLSTLANSAELISCEPGDVILEEGAPIDGLYLVRSGFMKFSRASGDDRRTVSYVSKGMTIGEVELLLEERSGSRFAVSSVGHGELVKVPAASIAQLRHTLPSIEPNLWQQAVNRIRDTGAALTDSRRSEFIDAALDQGLAQGNSILVIDLNLCTRCDDCVSACASTHGGRPRFVREGERLGDLLIAKSCYHCQDPVCLVGCPTGAIRRANVGDVVEIKEAICIGCGSCANNCPYDAIVMHDTGTVWPANALPKANRGNPRQVASKCDLCHTSPAGPACVRNCPQEAAFRVGSPEEFQQIQNRERQS